MDGTATLPELPDDLEWLNCPGGSLREQRGRVVALAFVNAASVWSRQRLLELEQWRARHAGRLQPIAIHVPRFDCEREPEFVLKLLRRHGVSMPMALDRDWVAWQQFGIRAWPTVLLIDAEGRAQAEAVGQDGIAEMEKAAALLCDALPLPHEDDLAAPVETRPEPRLPLRFPVGIAVGADRLFVADSGNHRILECTPQGRVLRRFGMGTADFIDGDGELAAFRHPQGLALAREWLYVADTGNHALRRINLRTGHVDTLCGNGRAGVPIDGVVAAPRSVALNQPTAVVATDKQLFLALAGDNRIWSYDLGKHRLDALAGSGQLELRDGSGAMAAFAQPVGLTMVQQQALYACDALSSAIRSVQMRGGLVQTRVGQGLWESGDVDGPRETARLQYPQALAFGTGSPLLWIADTGNACLRTLRLGGGEVATANLPRPLNGPAGLAVADGKVWIAETNAHVVLKFDPATGELERVPVDE